MFLKILGGLVLALVIFLGYVSTRNGHFHYERSVSIQAPAEKIFPYLIDFKKGSEWNPYEEKDPNMKKTYSGPEAQVGSVMEFDGNKDVGTGKLEILNIVPNETVLIKLTMIKPFFGENNIEYKLIPENGATKFTWSMDGEGGFMGKLMSVIIDCEKMMSGEFEKGQNKLKTLVESKG
jgi:hypothetical protein